MRKNISLNYDWKFQSYKNSLVLNDYELVNIPHNIKYQPVNYYNDKMYDEVCIYQKEFNINLNKEEVCFVTFEAVAHSCKVYINDEFVAEHLGGYNAFSYDITKYLKKNNVLSVVVNTSENQNFPPFGGQIDYMTFGGIYREVTLEIKPKNHVTFSKAYLENDIIKFESTFTNENNFKYEILDNNKVVATTTTNEVKFDYIPWDINNPKLYTVKVYFEKDVYEYKTGFRTIEVNNKGFYLNGNKIMIHGLNRHQSFPYVGYAMPKGAQYEEVRNLLTMVNCVRSSHYPQGRHFYNACDELGLLVVTEAPGWQYIGNDEWREEYKKNVYDMVVENCNHPSIISWGVRVNESPECNELFEQTAKIAHDLDNRPTCGVKNFGKGTQPETIYSYNDFRFNNDNEPLRDRKYVCDENSPYLVTEYNGHMFPTKSYDTEQRMITHALRYAKIVNAYSKMDIMGGIGWCCSDYNTHSDFGSGDGICHHGVQDIFRMDKFAASFYKSQKSKENYTNVISSMNIGNYERFYIDKVVIFTNADYILMYNGKRLVGKYFPNKEEYDALVHPPVIIEDMYKDVIEKEGISKELANRYIEIGKAIGVVGGPDKFDKPSDCLNATQEEFDTAWMYYGKYITDWGNRFSGYTFEAYKDDKLVSTIKKEAFVSSKLNVSTFSNDILIGETYEVAKVDIIVTDQNDNILKYAFDPIVFETNNLEVIGDSIVNLTAGTKAVWVKTVKPGKASLKIKTPFGEKEVVFNVKEEK